VKRSLQWKHRPCALLLFISSHDNRLIGVAGVMVPSRVVGGKAIGTCAGRDGHENFRCRES